MVRPSVGARVAVRPVASRRDRRGQRPRRSASLSWKLARSTPVTGSLKVTRTTPFVASSAIRQRVAGRRWWAPPGPGASGSGWPSGSASASASASADRVGPQAAPARASRRQAAAIRPQVESRSSREVLDHFGRQRLDPAPMHRHAVAPPRTPRRGRGCSPCAAAASAPRSPAGRPRRSRAAHRSRSAGCWCRPRSAAGGLGQAFARAPRTSADGLRPPARGARPPLAQADAIRRMARMLFEPEQTEQWARSTSTAWRPSSATAAMHSGLEQCRTRARPMASRARSSFSSAMRVLPGRVRPALSRAPRAAATAVVERNPSLRRRSAIAVSAMPAIVEHRPVTHAIRARKRCERLASARRTNGASPQASGVIWSREAAVAEGTGGRVRRPIGGQGRSGANQRTIHPRRVPASMPQALGQISRSPSRDPAGSDRMRGACRRAGLGCRHVQARHRPGTTAAATAYGPPRPTGPPTRCRGRATASIFDGTSATNATIDLPVTVARLPDQRRLHRDHHPGRHLTITHVIHAGRRDLRRRRPPHQRHAARPRVECRRHLQRRQLVDHRRTGRCLHRDAAGRPSPAPPGP